MCLVNDIIIINSIKLDSFWLSNAINEFNHPRNKQKATIVWFETQLNLGWLLRQTGNLKNHMKRHTSERDFTCMNCGKSFQTKKTLEVRGFDFCLSICVLNLLIFRCHVSHSLYACRITTFTSILIGEISRVNHAQRRSNRRRIYWDIGSWSSIIDSSFL